MPMLAGVEEVAVPEFGDTDSQLPDSVDGCAVTGSELGPVFQTETDCEGGVPAPDAITKGRPVCDNAS